MTRSWGAADHRRQLRPRERGVRHRTHSRQHAECVRRQRAHDVLSLRQLQPQRGRVRRTEQLLQSRDDAPQCVAPSDGRAHRRRQLLVRRYARALDAARQQRERSAARLVPHAAELQQPAVPRSDDGTAPLLPGSERHARDGRTDAHVRQSVLRRSTRSSTIRRRTARSATSTPSTSPTAGSSSTTRSAPTTRTTSALEGCPAECSDVATAAASPRARSSTISSITTSRARRPGT